MTTTERDRRWARTSDRDLEFSSTAHRRQRASPSRSAHLRRDVAGARREEDPAVGGHQEQARRPRGALGRRALCEHAGHLTQHPGAVARGERTVLVRLRKRAEEEGEARRGHRPGADRPDEVWRQLGVEPRLDAGEGLQLALAGEDPAAVPEGLYVLLERRAGSEALPPVEQRRGRGAELGVREPARSDAGRPPAEQRLARRDAPEPDEGGRVCAGAQLDLCVEPEELAPEEVRVRGENTEASAHLVPSASAIEGNISDRREPGGHG